MRMVMVESVMMQLNAHYLLRYRLRPRRVNAKPLSSRLKVVTITTVLAEGLLSAETVN
jgi:hypothetical protein